MKLDSASVPQNNIENYMQKLAKSDISFFKNNLYSDSSKSVSRQFLNLLPSWGSNIHAKRNCTDFYLMVNMCQSGGN